MLVQTMYRLILLTDGSGVASTTAPGAFGTGFADGGTVAGFSCDDGADGRTSVESAGGVALGHNSRLTVLSTMRTSGDRNLGSESIYVRWVHFYCKAEGELYNSPHSRDRSLRSGSNYVPKH